MAMVRFLAAARRAALLLSLALTGAPGMAAPLPPRVTVAGGVLEGFPIARPQGMVRAFLGIPYAAPPIGAWRWRPPRPAAVWQGVRQATTFGPRCMQRPLFADMRFRSPGMAEDCLYLNVWAPAAGTAYPVLVYLHGGGFLAGDGSEPRYDGAALAARGLVVVTLNYRLDVFGFLALPALAEESSQQAAGNYGLLDQATALAWVKANIAAFGGDPARITVGGESAGAMSVSALMASPLTRDLIAGALGESGALIAPLAPLPRAEAMQRGARWAARAGASSLTALRDLPAAALLEASAAIEPTPARPDVDGLFLSEPPEATFARGDQAKVPLLLGSNTQEGDYPALLHGATPTPAHYRAALRRLFGTQAAQALALYPGADEAQVRRSARELAGDLFVAHSTWRWMDAHRASGAPVYFYLYAHPRPRPRVPAAVDAEAPGAVHSAEIEYALDNLAGNPVYAWDAADRALAGLFSAYVRAFVAQGDPNDAGLPPWPAVGIHQDPVPRQWLELPVHIEYDPGAARHAFLRSYFATHRGEGW
ncbi:carboxylesterase/lipase family protein [Aerosticca soli]|nr:carboxylesterase family protein [Aerosticca soli]